MPWLLFMEKLTPVELGYPIDNSLLLVFSSRIPATSLEIQQEYKELKTFWAKRGDFSLREVI